VRSAASGLADALGFLTVLPVGRRNGLGTAFFPAVGLLMGAGLWATLSLPLPDLPRAALALVFWTLVDGGLHEDGWADCMDAALAPVSRERRLEILRDPRVGAHGLTGTVLLLLVRFAALAAVPPAAVVAAPVVGRWAMVLAPARFPAARPGGLGARFAREASPGWASATALLALGVAVLALVATGAPAASSGWSAGLAGGPSGVGGWGPGIAAWVTAAEGVAGAALGGLAGGWILGAFLAVRFGGLTGDGYGAVGLAAEVVALWTFIPWGT
jgi:adenosylcobinamide-GDP ribazoletransferase